MTGETKDIKKHILSKEEYPDQLEDSEDEEDELESESYDIETEYNLGIRERSNTAAQLDKIDPNKTSTKMQHIKWETNKSVPQEYLDELFVKRDISQIKIENKKSLVSEMLQKYNNLPVNPYIEYAKCDGSGQVNIQTRKYKIFLTMLPESKRNYPLHVCCISSVTIEDLIGLILLQMRWVPQLTYRVNTLNSQIPAPNIRKCR